jgi:hypothetical protein
MPWRIGFPYSRPSQDYKGAWVELTPSSHPGFREVISAGERFRIPQEDAGPRILDRLEGKGCVGLLHQWGEGQEILDRRGGTVCGQGRSMQLALILSSVGEVESPSEAPLVLISAAVDHPFGAPPFMGARAVPYAEASRLEGDLVDKYETAVQAGASTLVLPKRDANLLVRVLGEKSVATVKVKRLVDLEEYPSSPLIIGMESDEVGELAVQLGVPHTRFQAPSKPKSQARWAGVIVLMVGLLGLGISFWQQHRLEALQSDQLQRRRELIANIFSEPDSIHRRLRDESLIEFLEIERHRREPGYREEEEDAERIDLKEVALEGADLHSKDLSDINFLRADLRRVNFNQSNLSRCYFKGADLSGAHLYQADLRYAVLPLANLSRTNLRKTDLRHCVGLEIANLKGAQYDDDTQWPKGMDLKVLKEKGLVYRSSKAKPVFIWPGKKDEE